MMAASHSSQGSEKVVQNCGKLFVVQCPIQRHMLMPDSVGHESLLLAHSCSQWMMIETRQQPGTPQSHVMSLMLTLLLTLLAQAPALTPARDRTS